MRYDLIVYVPSRRRCRSGPLFISQCSRRGGERAPANGCMEEREKVEGIHRNQVSSTDLDCPGFFLSFVRMMDGIMIMNPVKRGN